MTRVALPAVAALLAACGRDDDLPWVSLEAPLDATTPASVVDQRGITIAVAPISSSVRSFELYEPLLAWISRRIGRPVDLLQRGSYHEVNQLIRRHEVALAFTCTGPWLLDGDGLDALAVPLVHGMPTYRAVCLTQAGREIEDLRDLAGASFGVADALSLAGRAYTEARLARDGLRMDVFFGRVIQADGHDVLLQWLARGEVDGACVNSLVWEDFNTRQPDLAARVEAFEISPPFGAPPVLVARDLDPALRADLARALLSMAEDAEGRGILAGLHIDGFIEPPPGLYDDTRRFLGVLQPSREP